MGAMDGLPVLVNDLTATCLIHPHYPFITVCPETQTRLKPQSLCDEVDEGFLPKAFAPTDPLRGPDLA